jgi:chorismate mutase
VNAHVSTNLPPFGDGDFAHAPVGVAHFAGAGGFLEMTPETPPGENAPPEESAMPVEAEPDIDALRIEIDRLDAEILAAVKRRTEVSQVIGKVRMASGGTRLVHSREMKVIERYGELGADGKDLAMLLLRMGRGRLGH